MLEVGPRRIVKYHNVVDVRVFLVLRERYGHHDSVEYSACTAARALPPRPKFVVGIFEIETIPIGSVADPNAVLAQ